MSPQGVIGTRSSYSGQRGWGEVVSPSAREGWCRLSMVLRFQHTKCICEIPKESIKNMLKNPSLVFLEPIVADDESVDFFFNL